VNLLVDLVVGFIDPRIRAADDAMSAPTRIEVAQGRRGPPRPGRAGQATWRRLARLRWGVGAPAFFLLIIAPLFSLVDLSVRSAGVDIRHRLSPPAWMEHGTVEHCSDRPVGRDLLARMIYGAASRCWWVWPP